MVQRDGGLADASGGLRKVADVGGSPDQGCRDLSTSHNDRVKRVGLV